MYMFQFVRLSESKRKVVSILPPRCGQQIGWSYIVCRQSNIHSVSWHEAIQTKGHFSFCQEHAVLLVV